MTLRLHHSNGAARDTVENVVERVAADIQIDGQPFNAADFCGTVFGLAIIPMITISIRSILPLTFLRINGDTGDHRNRKEKPQVVKHGFLQHIFSESSTLIEVKSEM